MIAKNLKLTNVIHYINFWSYNFYLEEPFYYIWFPKKIKGKCERKNTRKEKDKQKKNGFKVHILFSYPNSNLYHFLNFSI